MRLFFFMSPYTVSGLSYLDRLDELFVSDFAIAIFIEVVEQLHCVFVGQEVDAKVNEAPAEVVHFELSISTLVGFLENAVDSLDARR